MTGEQQLLVLKGMVAEMEPDERADVQACADRIRAEFEGKPQVAAVALAMVALDAQVNPTRYGLT